MLASRCSVSISRLRSGEIDNRQNASACVNVINRLPAFFLPRAQESVETSFGVSVAVLEQIGVKPTFLVRLGD
jgi:hypothetical protein